MRKRTLGAISAVVLGLFSLNSDAGEPARAVFVGAKVWTADGPDHTDFGGFSALELDDTGTGFVALTDKGNITKGRFVRDPAGRVIRVERAVLSKLSGPDGPLGERQTDSEGLALVEGGDFYVSFESANRILKYRTDGYVTAVPSEPDFAGLQSNSGLEALAVDSNGRLYTLPERSGKLTRPFPVWRYDGTNWQVAFEMSRSGSFLPVGADFGPDGWLYVLERGFNGFGFQSRIRRFPPNQSGIADGATLLVTSIGVHDNLEGISVWQDNDGAIRITMIADDNFKSFQRTEIVDYRLTQ